MYSYVILCNLSFDFYPVNSFISLIILIFLVLNLRMLNSAKISSATSLFSQMQKNRYPSQSAISTFSSINNITSSKFGGRWLSTTPFIGNIYLWVFPSLGPSDYLLPPHSFIKSFIISSSFILMSIFAPNSSAFFIYHETNRSHISLKLNPVDFLLHIGHINIGYL